VNKDALDSLWATDSGYDELEGHVGAEELSGDWVSAELEAPARGDGWRAMRKDEVKGLRQTGGNGTDISSVRVSVFPDLPDSGGGSSLKLTAWEPIFDV